MSTNPEDFEFLEHYGVKGMRWGVRKDRSRSRNAVSRTRHVVKRERRSVKSERKSARSNVKSRRRQTVQNLKVEASSIDKAKAKKVLKISSRVALGSVGYIAGKKVGQAYLRQQAQQLNSVQLMLNA